jgi:hypothetical protein
MLLLLASANMSAQLTNLGTDVGGGSGYTYTNYSTTTITPALKQVRILENFSTSSGSRKWEWNADSYYNSWRASAGSQTIAGFNQFIAPNSGNASAYWRANTTGTAGFLPATTSGNYYTFNVTYLSGNYRNENMAVLQTAYNPVAINGMAVAFTAGKGSYGATNVSLTSVPALNSGENLYCRYTSNGFSSSTLVQVTPSGSTASFTIPAQAANASVAFYFYTSNQSLSTIQSSVTTNGETANDMLTLNIQNNSGGNYNYTQPNGNVLVNASAGTTAPTLYSTLKAAFDAINAGTHQGVITIGIFGNTTETATAALNASGTGSASFTTIGIQPAGGGARTISGAMATGTSLINLNGADNVTIDGLNTGGNSLTISNTSTFSTAGTSTIQFILDATNNTIQNCTISGSSTVANSVSVLGGTIIFSTGVATTGTGNDGNIITNNTISSAGANLASCAICSVGTSSTIDNSGIQITNNNIQDYYSAANNSFGILAGNNNSTWSVTGNRFFQNTPNAGAARTATAGSTHEAIKISSGDGYTISGNFIGSATSTFTGTTFYAGGFGSRFIGIDLAVGTTNVTSVQNNTISNINLSTTSGATTTYGAFTGIYVTAGNVNIGTTTGNLIGNTTGTNFIFITSANTTLINGIASSSTGTVNISNNTIASFGTGGTASIGYTFNGINASGSGGNYNIYSNTIGSTSVANSIAIGVNTVTTATCNAIGITNTATGTVNIGAAGTGNTIANVALTTAASASGAVTAINNNGASACTITGNTINTLSANNNFGVITGIINNTAANISKNKLYDFSCAGTSPTITGINLTGAATNVFNNLIGDLRATGITNGTAPNAIQGINISSTSSVAMNLYYNTVYITGTATGTTAFGTAALYANTGPTLNLRNNILVNATTPKGTGIAVAYQRSSSTLTTYATTSNNNLFYAGSPTANNIIYTDGTNSDQTLAAFQTRMATRDAASVTENVAFQSTTGSNANFLKFPTTASLVESGGATIATYTDDYAGTTRAATPDIGAWELAGTAITPTIVLSSNTVSAGSITAGVTNNPVYSFGIAVTSRNASLTGLNITTTGTYLTADVTNFKAYYQTAATPFNAGTAILLSTFTNAGGAGNITFPSFTSQAIASGSTGYIFITADLPCTPTAGNTIVVSAVTAANTTFATGTPTGTPAAGTTQTIAAATPVNVTSLAASVLSTSSSVSWVNPTGCFSEVLVVAAPAANTGTPTGNGTAYTGSLTYGSGTGLGNGFVVYKGATSPQVVTGLTNGTGYYYKIFTRNGTTWSAGIEVGPITPALVYCTPSSSSGSTYISNFVTTGGISNISNNTGAYSATGYGNFTGQSVSQYPNTAINYTVSIVGGTASIGIWVDWNNNGLFTDAGENVYNSASYVSGASGSFSVPIAQASGNYRMRVLTDYTSTTPVPCSFGGTRGEAEDYTFTVTAPVTPTIALSTNNIAAGNITQNTTNNPIYSFAIGVTTANATLTGLTATTTGSYVSADVTNLKAWYQASSTFNAGTATLLSTFTTPGVAGLKTFPSFTSQAIASGATGYIFITADVPCGATAANTIAVNAIAAGNTTFTLGTPTGTPAAGNTQTVTAATINNATSPAATVLTASSSVSWVAPTGCVSDVLIVAATASNTGTPTGDGSAYTKSLTYGSGSALGNGFVVYQGSTSPQVITGLTNGTPYFYKIFTRFGTTWSAGIEVGPITPALVYCVGTFSNACSSNDFINNFSINTLSNNASGCNGNTNNYINYPSSSFTTSLTQSTSYTAAMTAGSGSGTHGAAVWIDFNQNGNFQDAGEFFLISNSVAASGSASTSIAIPATATLGQTRMRVRYAYSTTVVQSSDCSSLSYGETEDYTVTIAAPVTPTIALSTNNIAAGNIAQGTTNTPIYSFAIGVTTANATLTGLTATTTGSYVSADITNLKAWYQSAATFNSGTATLLSTYTNAGGAGSITFPSFTSQAIASGATGYIFITADVPCGATAANTIAVNAITATNTTFAAGTPTGTPASGNTQTFIAPTLNNVTSVAASALPASSSFSWTAPAGCVSDVLIVVATASNTGTPTGDGSSYTKSLTYGSGSSLGNGFVVYQGSTSPQVITGLTNGTQYFFKIFTRFGTSWNSGVEVSATPIATPCVTNTGLTGGWNFTAGTAAVSSTISNLTIGDLTQGNNNGTTTLVNSTSASSGYTGVSGTNNAGAATFDGALNTSTSTYFSFTLTPASLYQFSLTGISFGSRSTGTGPTNYVIRSSADNYASNLASGTMSTNSTWALFSNSLSLSSTSGVTIRIYGYGGTGALGNTAVWRIDDLTLTATLTNVPTTATVGSTQNLCSNLTSASLGGNTPVLGTGTWTQSSGPGTTTFSAVNSGSSTATASVVGAYNYTWTIDNGCGTPSTANVTVNFNNNPTITTSATTTAVTYSGSSQNTTLSYSATTALPDQYSITWNASPTNSFAPVTNSTITANSITIAVPASTNVGTYTGNISVKNSTSTCSSTSTAFTVTVNKATPTITTAPSATSICNGQTLVSSNLSGGVGSVAGSFAFTTPSTSPSVGTAGQSVTFTPTDTTNYNTATTNVNVTVSATSVAGTVSSAQTICSGNTPTTLSLTGYTGTIQWQSSTDNSSFSNISSQTSATYSPGALTTLTYYRAAVTNSPCAVANSNSVAITVNIIAGITAQPSATTVCTGSTATISVTASGTAPSYAWRKRGSGWTSGAWTGFVGSGQTLESAANNNSGDSGAYIDSSSNNKSWKLPNSTEAVRPLPTTLAVGQTINLDMDNGNVTSGVSVGYSLRNANDQNVWEFYFTGGLSNYLVNAGSQSGTLPSFTRVGLNIKFTLTSSTTYSALITKYSDNSTYTVTGTLLNPANGQSITKVRLWNFAGQSDAYYNNLAYGTGSAYLYDDNAGNYTSWPTDNNKGQGPLTNGATGNGSTISNATTNSISIASSASADAGSYDVVVYNSCGGAISTPVTLTVNPLTTPSVSIAANPGTTICSGTSITFTATPTNGGTAPTYQWKKNGTNVGTTNTYTDASLVASDAITCVMTPSADACPNTATATSNTLTISITAGIAITGQPTNQTACSSPGTAFYSVTATGVSLTYQWRLNGVNLSNGTGITGATTATLSLSNLTSSNTVAAGSGYDCIVSSTCGSPVTSTRVALTVSTVPSISGQPTAQSVCQTSGAASYSVTAAGDGLTYQWRLNGVNLTDGANISGSTTATLNLSNLTTSNTVVAGSGYDCVVSGIAPCSSVTSTRVALTVNAASVGGTATATLTSVCTGSNTSITLSSNTGSTIQWQQSADGSTGWASVTGGSGATSATYTTPNLTSTTDRKSVV